ncbi:MAG: heavy metal translocating P-type ATPase [Lentilactobacillus buchneri]|nr:heavy metal translocating P-type ATPase [Lentilactobacillus buchneri]MCI1950223.1 heavy metal translocating P-type ATPase [Lentilactobacillus buchneri]MCI2019449.1 heavy metal translocating P-type ATPase [Lentilactobacillus buchneri]MCI2027417.1 heavy metal translocating P-type ATPase [Lentilactobacillus buchneri]
MKKLKMTTKLYFFGLILYLLGLVLMFSGFNSAIVTSLFLIATVSSGYHVIFEGFEKTILESKRTGRFMPNIHLLMSLGAVGAILIGSYEEAALLVLIFAGAHFLEEFAEGKSRREIKTLLEMTPVKAKRIDDDGKASEISVNDVKIGDRIQVQNGDQVPIDGQIISGQPAINESAINGESIPREKGPGDNVFAGTVNGNATFMMTATKSNDETVLAKILKLVEQSQSHLSKTATRIKLLEPKYVTAVLILFPLVLAAGYWGFNWGLNVSLYRSIVFLISASPCAFAAAAVPATLSALSQLAKKGVLFKGGSYLSNLAELETVAFDKTGTLTKGEPEVTDFYLVDSKDKDKLTNIIFAIESQINHPLAAAIASHFVPTERLQVDVSNEIGKGVQAVYGSRVYAIKKPSLFSEVSPLIDKKMRQFAGEGKTVVYLAENDKVIGLIALMDTPNERSKQTIQFLKDQQIHTMMITGDSKQTGEAVGQLLGIDEVITNVLPEQKVDVIKQQKAQGKVTGMVGDGVNDAPALVTADIGTAMGDGTDVAVDVADVVLMKNDLSKFVTSYEVSKRLKKVVWQNIIFALVVVMVLVGLNFFGLMTIGLGVFMHEGSTLLVILNGLRLLKGNKDSNASVTKQTEPTLGQKMNPAIKG